MTSVLEEERLKDRLSRDDLQAIQLAAFVYGLQDFLREGSRAAARAADAFAALGVEGFKVGREYFSGRNEAVTRGEILANQLVDELRQVPGLTAAIERHRSLRTLVVTLAKERARVGRMDQRR